jgi:hypothetical protein
LFLCVCSLFFSVCHSLLSFSVCSSPFLFVHLCLSVSRLWISPLFVPLFVSLFVPVCLSISVSLSVPLFVPVCLSIFVCPSLFMDFVSLFDCHKSRVKGRRKQIVKTLVKEWERWVWEKLGRMFMAIPGEELWLCYLGFFLYASGGSRDMVPLSFVFLTSLSLSLSLSFGFIH